MFQKGVKIFLFGKRKYVRTNVETLKIWTNLGYLHIISLKGSKYNKCCFYISNILSMTYDIDLNLLVVVWSIIKLCQIQSWDDYDYSYFNSRM